MVRLSRTIWSLAATGLLSIAACSPASTPSSVLASESQDLQLPSGSAGSDAAALDSSSLLQRIQGSYRQTRYSGTRRVELHFDDGGVPGILEYREDVACDGDGQFSIDTTEVLAGASDPDLFKILQNARQVFTYKYRDFRITDRALMRTNYRVRHESSSDTVAGVPCLRMRFDRLQPGDRFYRVWVEPNSGLVLRWQQRSAAGLLLGEMEFETVDFDPDLSNFILVSQNFNGRGIDVDRDLAPQVGFSILKPALLPAGYVLESAEVMVGALGHDWFKRVYTDGVSRLAFLHRRHLPDTGPDSEDYLGSVQSMRVGPWNVVTGVLAGWSLIIMGQLDEDELFQTLQSAF